LFEPYALAIAQVDVPAHLKTEIPDKLRPPDSQVIEMFALDFLHIARETIGEDDPARVIFVHLWLPEELDRKTGESRAITSGYGGGLRPIVSPDGHWLVYATRHDAQTALRIRDLKTLQEEWLVAAMQRDDQEGYAPNDVLPGYGFTPDSRAVVFTGDGKIGDPQVEERLKEVGRQVARFARLHKCENALEFLTKWQKAQTNPGA